MQRVFHALAVADVLHGAEIVGDVARLPAQRTIVQDVGEAPAVRLEPRDLGVPHLLAAGKARLDGAERADGLLRQGLLDAFSLERLGGDAVDLGQPLVDADEAEVAVEEPDADGRGVVERLELRGARVGGGFALAPGGLGLLQILDVGVAAEPFADLPVRIVQRLGEGAEPAIGAVVAADAELALVVAPPARRPLPARPGGLPIVRMQALEPAGAELVLGRNAGIARPLRG